MRNSPDKCWQQQRDLGDEDKIFKDSKFNSYITPQLDPNWQFYITVDDMTSVSNLHLSTQFYSMFEVFRTGKPHAFVSERWYMFSLKCNKKLFKFK